MVKGSRRQILEWIFYGKLMGIGDKGRWTKQNAN
jgi:hypothetical protein